MASLPSVLRDHYEVIILDSRTVPILARRTQYTEEQLKEMLTEAYSKNEIKVFTLHRLEKLS